VGSVVKRYDVVAGRKYSTRNGEEKTHWINVGEGTEWDDGGISLRMHAIPVGDWFTGDLKLFERKPKEEQQAPQRSARSNAPRQAAPARQNDGFEDDDIPF